MAMSGFDSFLGNERLITRLKRDITAQRLSHAYIIEGVEGCGKRTLAKLIAAAVSCQDGDTPCMKCVNCSKINRDQSPDVILVKPENDRIQLGVDVIRKLRDDAVYAPIDLVKKFFIIPKADAMNPQAQNAFLKILEEPPSHVMFLILCENADNLLPTIRSRAPIFRVEGLQDDIISAELARRSEPASRLLKRDPDAFAAAVKLSHGSLGTAIMLADDEHADESFELYKKTEHYIELLANRSERGGELAFHEFSVKLAGSGEREKLAKIYSLLADAVRDLINVKLAKEPNTIFYTSVDTARQMSDKFPVGRLMRLTEILFDARTSLSHNVNMNLSQVQTSAAVARLK